MGGRVGLVLVVSALDASSYVWLAMRCVRAPRSEALRGCVLHGGTFTRRSRTHGRGPANGRGRLARPGGLEKARGETAR